jgi:16S rRNA (adenine1518-N6/adenine1519-N6)-dimethyltransferase
LSFRAHHPKKRLGQHFLTDPNTARIVACGVAPGDVVLEIGAGRGFLTSVLAQRAEVVHAVELDPDVLPALRRTVKRYGNVRVYEGDALHFDYDALEPRPNRLVANLPYNVASPLILLLLEEAPYLAHLRFMVQLEVARRMAGARGTKDYAAYAVLIGLLARARVVHKVSPKVFDPPPRVYSAIVDMHRKEAGPQPAEYRGVKELVVAAFASRRKRLLNNLPEAARARARRALYASGLGVDARAEQLRPEDFVALYRTISEKA